MSSERKAKFKVGMVVATVGTLIKRYLPPYWRIAAVRREGDGWSYQCSYYFERGPWVAEKQLRRLTDTEIDQ